MHLIYRNLDKRASTGILRGVQVWNEKVNTCCFYYVWLHRVFWAVAGRRSSPACQAKFQCHRQLSLRRSRRVGHLGPKAAQTSPTCPGRKDQPHLPTVSDTSLRLKLNLTKPIHAAPPSRPRSS